jgi:hypothetical protein
MSQSDRFYPNLDIKSFDYGLELKETWFSGPERFHSGTFEK